MQAAAAASLQPVKSEQQMAESQPLKAGGEDDHQK